MTRTFRGQRAYGEPRPRLMPGGRSQPAPHTAAGAPARSQSTRCTTCAPPSPRLPAPPPDGGFRRALPCPPGVTYCVTASVLPPLDYNFLLRELLEGASMRALGNALRSTMGSSPWHFMSNVRRRRGVEGWRFGETAEEGTRSSVNGVRQTPRTAPCLSQTPSSLSPHNCPRPLQSHALRRQLVRASRHSPYKMEEVVYGLVSYVGAVNPGSDVHIYPGAGE